MKVDSVRFRGKNGNLYDIEDCLFAFIDQIACREDCVAIDSPARIAEKDYDSSEIVVLSRWGRRGYTQLFEKTMTVRKQITFSIRQEARELYALNKDGYQYYKKQNYLEIEK